ncbi:hypothetical protein NKH80_01880 [Mesorhizobium sp. M0904]|uniref:hypothetical protein n=1 Tax=unclassified Mesorhizobium TaxID=325217 RepID=UPI003335BC80
MIDEFAALPAEAKAQLTILGDANAAPLSTNRQPGWAFPAASLSLARSKMSFHSCGRLILSFHLGVGRYVKVNAPENSLSSLKIVKYNSTSEAIVAYVLA